VRQRTQAIVQRRMHRPSIYRARRTLEPTLDLRPLFVVVALLEFGGYFLASMMPPRYVTQVTGWVLSPRPQLP